MMPRFSEITKARISIWHFLIVFIATFLSCSFLYILAIPIFFWMVLGESAESDRIASLPFNVFLEEWLALILVLFSCLALFSINWYKSNLQRAKSYVLTAVIISICYLLRHQVAGFIIERWP